VKEIDANSTIYEITQADPELIEILKDVGFAGVANPVARNTVGRATTLVQGSEKHGLDLEDIAGQLRERGYELKW
jgi:translation initiation factor 1 (eIF-1/SUI1)